MAVFLGPCLSILVCLLNPGSCVGRAGALASSLCISSKDSTLGFVGEGGFRIEVDLVLFSHVVCGVY